MPKRMTGTEKWRDPWFRKLAPELKLFWLYLLDECDHAGVWVVDVELASLFIGAAVDSEAALQAMGERVEMIEGGKRWWVRGFVEYQYGEFSQKNPCHRGVLKVLEKYGLQWPQHTPTEGAAEPLPTPCQGDKDKDKDRGKVKGKDDRGGVGGSFVAPSAEEAVAYVEAEDLTADGADFFDYYSARGWKLASGQEMECWRSEIRRWSRRNKEAGQDAKNKRGRNCISIKPAAQLRFTRHEEAVLQLANEMDLIRNNWPDGVERMVETAKDKYADLKKNGDGRMVWEAALELSEFRRQMESVGEEVEA